MTFRRSLVSLATALVAAACGPAERAPATPSPPSILLVTLDTTRADFVGPGAPVETPAFDALAARGTRFLAAYTTAPTTLPAHASMLSGLYPAAHGVHENARRLDDGVELAAERLRHSGYATAAFLSGFPLDARFGLARGFRTYDDEVDGSERRAAETTHRALAWLDAAVDGPPVFLWVHYFDAHDPYEPPEPWASRYPEGPYGGEIAYVDHQMGRLVSTFETRFPDARILVVGDHGEGLGEHGEARHGNLLYDGVMRVPLVISGRDVPTGERVEPVSVRRVYDTLLTWAGVESGRSLLEPLEEPVLGEAMKPYLHYGWQPQVMVVAGGLKAIRAGGVEVYDLAADPSETTDLGSEVRLPPELREALGTYPLPGAGSTAVDVDLSPEERARLAALGYVASSGPPPELSPDAPRPRDRTDLFADLDRASGLFARGDYEAAIPVFESLLERDPQNLMVAVRLAVAHSLLGHEVAADRSFDRAAAIDPASTDLAHYRALHLLRRGDSANAGGLLETVLAAQPDRLPALDALARVRAGQGRLDEATALLHRANALDPGDPGRLVLLGELEMTRGATETAIDAFERARSAEPETFERHLELGVLYLAARRLEDARESLDRVPADHPGYPMALFKRAQASVLLGEPDREERVRTAWRQADPTTRELIARESLFRGVPLD